MCMWGFIAASTIALGKAALLMHGAHELEQERLATILQVTAAVLLLCAVGCANIRAMNKRAAGQVVSRNEEAANGS